jgi:hypothetical protein
MPSVTSLIRGVAAFGRITLSNVGAKPLGLSSGSLASTGDTDFRVAQNQCRSALLAGVSCDVRVQLLPSKLGPIESKLLVQTASGATLSVPLRGRGARAAS